jgi:exodeoxyribonuclease V alpha subunit
MTQHTAQQLALVGEEGPVALEGNVTRVRFANAQNGFGVVEVNCGGRKEVVAGAVGALAVGATVRIRGTREKHPKFGDQIMATSVIPVTPTTVEGIAVYLSTLPGVGEVSAKRIVARYGERAVATLIASPEDVARTCRIAPARAAAAAEAAKLRRAEEEVTVYLLGIGLSPAFTIRVLKEWGAKAPSIIERNPYQLARDIPLIGFVLADSIALGLGVKPESLARREAAIFYVLEEAAGSGARYKRVDHNGVERETSTGGGHVFLPRSLLLVVTSQICGTTPAAIDEALANLSARREVVIDSDAVMTHQLAQAETSLAARIALLLCERDEPPAPPAPGTAAAAVLDKLSDEQRAAVATVRTSGVTVITGGPGTGKSFTMRAVVEAWEAAKRRVALCAPTGRAAKRLEETTGREASTVHRLLQRDPVTGGFVHNEKMPLEVDLVICDEASMLDTPLARSLFAAVPPGASVLLVGDVDQLPSVGPGQVLADVINSGVVPVARLSRIFRQKEGSRISVAASEVLAGRVPSARPGDEFEIVPVMAPSEEVKASELAASEVLRFVTQELPRQGFQRSDIQVLVPMHKGPAGTRELNLKLQQALNPAGADLRGLRVGDPVMQLRNNYNLEVMNGDLGRVLSVDPGVPNIIASFDGREVGYEKEAIGELQLAYAMSIHKSQGSEFAAVVIPMTSDSYVMLRKNLLYTAITRGKRKVVVVGEMKALGRAVRTQDTSTRYTRLKQRLVAGGAPGRANGAPGAAR